MGRRIARPHHTPLAGEGSVVTTHEHEEKSHGHGDHWGCFTEDVSGFIREYLPMTINEGTLMTVVRKNEKIMTSAQKGSQRYPAGLFWPESDLRFLSLLMIDNEVKKNEILSAYPFAISGVPQNLTIEDVIPWKNTIEGQIKVLVAETVPLTFFDTLYYINYPQYLIGESYQFSLSSFAYRFSVVEPEPIRIADPEAIRRLCSAGFGKPKTATDGQIEPIVIETKGMASLIQIDGWDDDDYSFRAPVVEVEEAEFLGEPLWRVRATVLRVEDCELDLNIYVTRKVMGDGRMPMADDDIGGALWLQGYLLPEE